MTTEQETSFETVRAALRRSREGQLVLAGVLTAMAGAVDVRARRRRDGRGRGEGLDAPLRDCNVTPRLSDGITVNKAKVDEVVRSMPTGGAGARERPGTISGEYCWGAKERGTARGVRRGVRNATLARQIWLDSAMFAESVGE